MRSLIIHIQIILFSSTFLLGQDKSALLTDSILAATENLPISERLNRRLAISETLYNQSDYSNSLVLVEKVLNDKSIRHYDSIHCAALFRKGENSLFVSRYDSAIIYLNRSLQVCNGNDPYKVGKSYLRLGNSHNHLGDFDTALSNLQKAELIFKELDDQKSLASVHNSMALVYGDSDRENESLEYLLKTLEYFKDVKDTFNLGVIENNIGLLYYDKADTANALKYYSSSLKHALESDNIVQQARTYTNLGNLHNKLGNPDSAIIYYRKSQGISLKSGNRYSLANIHFNMGSMYNDIGSLDSGEYHISKSMAICEELKIYEGLFHCNMGLGKNYSLRKKHSKAIEYYLNAYNLAESFSIKTLLKEAASKLHESYRLTQDFESALFYFDQYNLIVDSLESVAKESEFKELSLQYETQLKEEENKRLKELNARNEEMLSQQNTYLLVLFVALFIMLALIFVLTNLNNRFRLANTELENQREDLNIKNYELKKVNNELNEVIGIKNKLMSVISHDLRSPMASLQGLIALLQNDSMSKEEFTEVVKKIETNLLNFSKFSDNILQWVKGQSNGIQINKENFSLCELISTATDLHARHLELKNIKFEKNCVPDDSLVLADKEGINIVLRNLISNAIKFSPIGGTIQVNVRSQESGILCSITDSGMGMDDKLVEMIKNRKPIMPSAGTSNEKGLGLGLSLSIEFLKMNDSQLEIESIGGQGTTFSFVLSPAEVEVTS